MIERVELEGWPSLVLLALRRLFASSFPRHKRFTKGPPALNPTELFPPFDAPSFIYQCFSLAWISFSIVCFVNVADVQIGSPSISDPLKCALLNTNLKLLFPEYIVSWFPLVT